MAVRVLEEAAAEAIAAVGHYRKIRPELAVGFAAALVAGIARLEQKIAPLTGVPGRAGEQGALRLMLKGFPFDVVVLRDNDDFVVIAVAHQRRRPGYWRDRLFTPGK